MSIKVIYYHHTNGVGFQKGEELTIKNKKIYLNSERSSSFKQFGFFYDDTSMQINTKQSNNKLKKVQINRILTENVYHFGQNQYLVHMNWLQRQKLLWMFQRHWLQKSHNTIQIIIIFIIIVLAGLGYNMLQQL